MSLDKAIAAGVEWRKPYYRSALKDRTCRNHGSCSWCERGRTLDRAGVASRADLEAWRRGGDDLDPEAFGPADSRSLLDCLTEHIWADWDEWEERQGDRYPDRWPDYYEEPRHWDIADYAEPDDRFWEAARSFTREQWLRGDSVPGWSWGGDDDDHYVPEWWGDEDAPTMAGPVWDVDLRLKRPRSARDARWVWYTLQAPDERTAVALARKRARLEGVLGNRPSDVECRAYPADPDSI